MNTTATWFVLADTGVKPGTTLHLGQLITDPFNPQFRLADQPLSINPNEITHGNPEEKVHIVVDHKKGLKLGVGLVIVNFFNFCVNANRTREGRSDYTIEKVTTNTFTPSGDYVQRSMTQPPVIKYLQEHRHSVYMVVGLKIAHNANVIQSQSKESGGGPDIGPLGLAAVSPVDMNFKASVVTQRTSEQSRTVLGDFIFAYRLRKCFYHRESGLGSIKPNHYTKGADLLNHGLKTDEEEVKESETSVTPEGIIIVPDKIATVDLNSKVFKVPATAVAQAADQGVCEVVLLSRVARLE